MIVEDLPSLPYTGGIGFWAPHQISPLSRGQIVTPGSPKFCPRIYCMLTLGFNSSEGVIVAGFIKYGYCFSKQQARGMLQCQVLHNGTHYKTFPTGPATYKTFPCTELSTHYLHNSQQLCALDLSWCHWEGCFTAKLEGSGSCHDSSISALALVTPRQPGNRF